VMMDPPNHTAMRRLVSKAMTPRRVESIDGIVREFVDARLDMIGGECDIVDVLFKPLPSFVVAHYLGVPEEDRERFDGWTNSIVAATASSNFEDATEAFMSLFAFGDELIARRQVEPGDDLMSSLVEVGPEVASAGWIVGFVFTMVTGGNDTTTGLLSGAAELMTKHRDHRQLLLDDLSRVTPSIEEFLRLTSPVQNLARTTTCDVEIHDTVIPEGKKVMLLYGSANRDEREFGDDAGELNVQREIDKMVSHGYGAHHCLGAAAARLQTSVALERILARFPDFSVDHEAGKFAAGSFVRRYESLPFSTTS
jgi:cytochrome P450